MNTTYEHKNELTFIGFHTEIAPDEGFQKCPEFWDKEYNEKYARLWQTMKPETAIEAAILENGIGMYAICADDENGFSYWIAGLYKGGEVPGGLELFAFPESDWAIFSAKGPIPQSLQTLNTHVWNEWAPNIKRCTKLARPLLKSILPGIRSRRIMNAAFGCRSGKKADLKICQCCGLPMESDDVLGTNADGSLNEDYCKYCYTNGDFIEKVWRNISKCVVSLAHRRV